MSLHSCCSKVKDCVLDTLNIGKEEMYDYISASNLIFVISLKEVATMCFKLNTNDSRIIINTYLFINCHIEKMSIMNDKRNA